jgi:hypothetical protein
MALWSPAVDAGIPAGRINTPPSADYPALPRPFALLEAPLAMESKLPFSLILHWTTLDLAVRSPL